MSTFEINPPLYPVLREAFERLGGGFHRVEAVIGVMQKIQTMSYEDGLGTIRAAHGSHRLNAQNEQLQNVTLVAWRNT